MPDRYDQPPFPRMEWKDGMWEAETVLPEWAGFQTRRGWYCGISSPAPSNGSVLLRVFRPEGGVTTPSAEQIAAYRHFRDNGSAVRDAILAAVFAEYPTYREEYCDAYAREESEQMPALERPDQLRSLMGLGNLFILDVWRDGMGYVGFEFGCVWEEEHGLGVLTHAARVVEIGQAPTAFDSHAAKKDAIGG
jgi:hypothetical protein